MNATLNENETAAETKAPIEITEARRFITAGKAIFTVANDKGQHYTFQVRLPDVEEGQPAPREAFLSVLTGADNTSDYTYAGMLNLEHGQLRQTRGSKIGAEATSYKVAAWALNRIWHNVALPAGYALHHEGKCACCGRKLTTPESVLAGFGPICAAKH